MKPVQDRLGCRRQESRGAALCGEDEDQLVSQTVDCRFHRPRQRKSDLLSTRT